VVRLGRFRFDIFVAALVVSVVFHVTVIIPKMFAPLVEKPDRPVEIALNPEEPQQPEIPPPAASEEKPEKKKKAKKEKEKPAPEPGVLDVKIPEKPPEPPPPPEPLVKMQPPPPPPEKNQISVDQDQFKEEEDNPDARFLSQKNHRVKEDVQGKNRNLVRAQESQNDHSSAPNENKDQPDPGHKDEKIAELQKREGSEEAIPRGGPKQGDQGKRSDEKPGPLSMRDLTPKSQVEPARERNREGVEMQEVGPGGLPMARIGRDQERARSWREGGKHKLTLDHRDYDSIVGHDVAADERSRAARAEVSHKKGRYDKYLERVAMMRSQIENFVGPDVKLGNQQELGTRRSPFAGYITAMHRQIHKFFGDGFLADLDGKLLAGQKTPYDDTSLSATLEIVITPDGKVEKVTIVRTSGVTGFDIAALDSVQSAAPFRPTPKDIRSTNGRVYLHWRFNRNEEACTTAGVHPYILNNGEAPPKDVPEPGREEPRQLAREKEEQHTHIVVTPGVEVPTVTEEARNAAEGWFAGFAGGRVKHMAGWSATPFSAGGEVVARDGAKLVAIYEQLVGEMSSRKASKFEVLTPAGIRAKLGGLPPGGEDTGMLYAVGKIGGDEFILLLKKSNQGWRVCGLDR
jgi:TonB family protein